MDELADQPRLLPGRSALFWVRVAAASVLADLGLFVLIGLEVLLLSATPRLFAMGTTGAVIVLSAIVWIVASIGEGRATMRERASGYTTVFNRYTDLWQLDPKTGAALRRPGEAKIK